MPILPSEPCVFPDELLTSPDLQAEGPGRWWVLHTRPRAEKALAQRLRARRVSFFLPLYKDTWRTRGRSHTAYLPLFPSYLFLHGDHDARHAALATNTVVQVLSVVDQEQLLAELVHVHRLLSGEAVLTPETGLQPGALVEITAGPFEGLRGKVRHGGGKTKLVVEVTFLRQGVSLSVEPWMVRPVDDECPAGSAQPVLAASC
jgi:transcriptional antiterminator RfaH